MKEINLNHICKIEGHAHLNLKIENNRVIQCELKAQEGARFFESLVLGKKVEDIQEIVSRICGICSVAHSVACVAALEEALGIKPTKYQKDLREILMIGERIRSHVTHLYFLALPDYYGFDSAIEMTKDHREKIDNALKLISIGNKIIEEFAGREIHPFLNINQEIEKKDYSKIINELEDSKNFLKKTIDLFSGLKIPNIQRQADYLSLKDTHYATISGKIVSSSEKFIDDDYKVHLQENIKEYATSKFVLKNKKPYVVGAIARIFNNKELLEEYKDYLSNLDIENPFSNNMAQAIELEILINRAIKIIKEIKPEKPSILKIKPGRGVSAVEAPRGTLFHEYEINPEGKIAYCNIITPTAQNLNSMELDIKALVNILLEKNESKEKIIREIEKLIRAYDPCFSCSTHFLKVNWSY
ncbi:MAG: Ni/Fe hydrogenase subunit alpha [Candidatus Nanoarchaeia archaeon]